MTHTVFVAPFLMPTTAGFVAAAAGLPGVRLGLVTQQPAEALPPRLKSRLEAHYRVDNALDPGELTKAVRWMAGKMGGVDRVVGSLEQLQVPLGQVRDALGLPGMDAETARNFRDKSRMKSVLRAAGVPCARHALVAGAEDARAFAEKTGFPLVAKPPAGAGAKATFRIEDAMALEQVLDAMRPGPGRELLLEEFIVGQESSFETISIDGKPVWWSVSHYRPTPLEVLENPWIQWCILLPRETPEERYRDLRKVGFAALKALGMGTGLSHMEWFQRRDGSLAVSEVGARPPGAQITTLLSYAHEVNFKETWARVVLQDRLELPERRYATGAAFLRGQGPGQRVKAIRGLKAAQQEIGEVVVEAHLPKEGQVQASGYEGEGFVILRHPSTEVVSRALQRLITLVRVELG